MRFFLLFGIRQGIKVKKKVYQVWVDRTKPTFKSTYDYNGKWMNDDTRAEIPITEIHDKLSGIKQVRYILNEEETVPIEVKKNAVTLNLNKIIKDIEEGKHELKIEAEDNAGNKAESKVYQVWVDWTAPKISYEYKDNNKWVNGDKDIQIILKSVEDNLSDTVLVNYSINDGTDLYSWKKGKDGYKLNVLQLFKDNKIYDGKSDIIVYVSDEAGNTVKQKFVIKLFRQMIQLEQRILIFWKDSRVSYMLMPPI